MNIQKCCATHTQYIIEKFLKLKSIMDISRHPFSQQTYTHKSTQIPKSVSPFVEEDASYI